MWPETEVTAKLGIRYPIIQAGMAGGITTPEMVAAVSNAGGLGTIGAGYMSVEQMRKVIREVRALTTKPFAVNLFIPQPVVENPKVIDEMNYHLDYYRQKLHLLKRSPEITPKPDDFSEKIEVILEEEVSVFSFTFGALPQDILTKMKNAGITLIGTATTVEEGIYLENSGVDLVVAQGWEAGGHRATFMSSFAEANLGTMVLVPQLADRLCIPVIAAGGIMDARGIAACLHLGAQGVQLGTAFLTCKESGAHRAYKEALLYRKKDEPTDITIAFSGRPARGIKNTFMEEMKYYQGPIPAYPLQHYLTEDIRSAAARQEKIEYMSLWAGQGFSSCQERTARELMKGWIQETTQLMNKQMNEQR